MAKVVIRPVGGQKGIAYITTEAGGGQAPVFKLPNGQTITGVRASSIGRQWAENTPAGTQYQWLFPNFNAYGQPITVTQGGQSKQLTFQPNLEFRTENGGLAGVDAAPNKAGGGINMGGDMAFPGGFAPGQVGYGFYPAYLGGQFPSPTFADFNPIKAAKYNFTDAQKFAEQFGEFNRGELRKNFDLSKDLALESLDLELKGLSEFLPAASALKRQETSLDNQFNQSQRTAQIDQTLPGARADLEAQAGRARTYASGRLPGDIEDRALELTSRSRAADLAAAGGFGADSSVARKASDLMSAEERFKVAQYGESLTGQNINQSSQLLLAPTEYSNAGSQISVMPSVSASQLAQSNFGELNRYSSIPTTEAYQGTIQQEQFRTNLAQRTNEFNASGNFAESQFNAGVANNFALTKFGYDVGFAGTVAGAAQTNSNTQFALQQQQQYQDIFGDYLHQAQGAGQIGAIASGIGNLLGGFGGLGNVISSIGSLFGGGGGGGSGSSGGGSFVGDLSGGSGGGSDVSNAGSFIGNASDFFDGSGGASGFSSGGSGANDAGELASGGEGISTAGSYATPALQSFSNDTGISYEGASYSPKQLIQSGEATLNTAGIYNAPRQDIPMQSIGVSNTGAPIFAAKALLSNDNAGMGTEYVNTVHNVVGPMGAFAPEDSSKISEIGRIAGNGSLIANIGAQLANGDKRGAINTILGAFKQPLIDAISKDPQTQSGLNSAFQAFQLINNWGRMSNAQKGLGLASIGLGAYKSVTGHSLASQPIIKDSSIPGGQVTVGQGLSLLQAGYNTYSLIKNWNQLNPLQKIAAGTGDVASIANLAKSFGMLGKGVTGAEVGNVTGASLAQAGWTTAPQFGPGAIVASSDAIVPAGYTSVATPTGLVATPTGTATATSNAVSPAAGSLLPTAAGVASVAAGAYTVYKGWGQGGTKGAVNGLIGGSAMAAGLYTLGATNPFLLGGVAAVSILGGLAHTGKSGDQKDRDAIRGIARQLGMSDDNYKVPLADGTVADIGIDGHGGKHQVTNRDALTAQQKDVKDLNSWDIDYTNDLDFASGMGGIALSRLLSGGKGKNIDQVGGQFGNAALGSVGFGKEMNAKNFDTVMGNLRSMYARSGIKSKADAYQLANQAFAEGRIDESDMVSMHQTFNMMYDKGSFRQAQALMSGRQRGVEVAHELAEHKPAVVQKTPAMYVGNATKNTTGNSQNFNPLENPEAKKISAGTTFRRKPLLTRRPEEIKAQNAKRYQNYFVTA